LIRPSDQLRPVPLRTPVWHRGRNSCTSTISGLHASGADGVNVMVAAKRIHNNNGPGRGGDDDELLIGTGNRWCVGGGEVEVGQNSQRLSFVVSIQVGKRN
jgi:hypothetical protein